MTAPYPEVIRQLRPQEKTKLVSDVILQEKNDIIVSQVNDNKAIILKRFDFCKTRAEAEEEKRRRREKRAKRFPFLRYIF